MQKDIHNELNKFIYGLNKAQIDILEASLDARKAADSEDVDLLTSTLVRVSNKISCANDLIEARKLLFERAFKEDYEA
jgi:hypothetical protein